jgi:hypothetical protein
MPSEEKPKKGTKEKRGSEKTKAAGITPVTMPITPEPSNPVKVSAIKATPSAISTTSASKPKKAAAPKAATVKASTKKSKPATGKATIEQIQLRAYFIAERRKTQRIEGNEASDWIQAERELRGE